MNSLIDKIYHALKRTWYGDDISNYLKYLFSIDFFHRRLRIDNQGSVRFARKEVRGGGNIMVVGKHSMLNRLTLKIKGHNNKIWVGENCKIGKKCKFYLYGNNLELIIGNNNTFNHDVELLCQEDNSKIVIGNDCMFSHHINVRTSDSHPIFDIDADIRCNNAKDVYIGDHVWVTAHCIIQKGSRIGAGSVIASSSVVTKDVPENCVAAGMPAKIVKKNVRWERHFPDKK